MKFIDDTIKKLKSDERGIALLFTLGILSLLLVLAIAFATTAIIERKAAANYASNTNARLLADSAYSRVLGVMKDIYTDSTTSDIFPGTDVDSGFFRVLGLSNSMNERRILFSYSSGADSDMVDSALALTFNYGLTTDSKFVDFDATPTFFPTWENIGMLQNIGTGTDTDKLIGRVAYIVIDESGKLDPNYVKATPQYRPGVSTEEIDWNNLGLTSSTTVFNNIVDNANGKVFSWKHLGKFINSDSYDISNKILFPYSQPVREAFVDTPSGYGLYHRFNLARTDWNTVEVDSIVATPATYAETDSPHNGNGILWLSNWGDMGTFTTNLDRAKQIAANMIDYCDADDDVTTDNENNPTYTGLEQTPYINEVRVMVRGFVTENGDAGTGYTYTCVCQIPRIDLEIINLYAAKNCKAEISFDYSYRWLPFNVGISDVSGSVGPITINGLNTGANEYNSGTYSTLIDISPPTPTVPTAGTYGASQIQSIMYFRITNLKVKLTDNSTNKFYDFSNIVDMVGPGGLVVSPSPTAPLTDKYIDYEVNDPRQNLNKADWTRRNSYGEYDHTIYGIDIDATNTKPNPKNSVCDPVGSGKDYEPSANYDGDPSSGAITGPLVSTNYIKNATFQSPWELGCIHRGGAWETLNFNAFGGGQSGGGAYANGDANILDQIKMTADSTTPFKVNINSPYDDVLEALFLNIYINGNYSNPSSQTGQLIDTYVPNIVQDGGVASIAYNNGYYGGSPFINRGQVANASRLRNIDGSQTIQNNDAKKEEIIGKFINLVDVSQNYFTLILAAQTIKDIGGGVSLARIPDQCHDVDGNKPGANKTFNNCQYNAYDKTSDGYYGVDEILSSQKIKVIIYRDAILNKWKVLSYETVEE